MLIHKGTQTIETPRLILRPFEVADAGAMFRNWASDPEVTQFLTWPTHTGPQISEMVLRSWVESYSQDNYYAWAIVLKESGEPIGSISGMDPQDSIACVEIGYCIGKSWWHQGIMTEALRGVMDYLFSIGFNRIFARHDPNNPHSGAVMIKCGMVYEGRTA